MGGHRCASRGPSADLHVGSIWFTFESKWGGAGGGVPAVASTAPPRVLESMGTWSGVVACSSWPRSAGSGSKVPLGVGCYDGPTYSPSWGPCTSRRQPRCPPNSSPTSASTTCTSTRGWGTSWSADNGIWRQPTEVDKFYSADVNAPPPPQLRSRASFWLNWL